MNFYKKPTIDSVKTIGSRLEQKHSHVEEVAKNWGKRDRGKARRKKILLTETLTWTCCSEEIKVCIEDGGWPWPWVPMTENNESAVIEYRKQLFNSHKTPGFCAEL